MRISRRNFVVIASAMAARAAADGFGHVFSSRPGMTFGGGVNVGNSPIIPDDANTVAHLWVDGGQILDTKGVVWTETGTVPRVARATLGAPFTNGKTAEGLGPFSGANYLSSVDSAPLIDAPYMLTVIGIIPSVASKKAVTTVTSGVGGFELLNSSTTALRADCYGLSSNGGVTQSGLTAGSLFVCSSGRPSHASGAANRIKVNLLATVSNSPAVLSAAGIKTSVGISNTAAASTAWTNTIYEFRINATDPTDAAMTALHTTILTL